VAHAMIPPLADRAAVSPVAFLQRAAAVFPTRTGVVDGERRWTWEQLAERARRLAVALQAVGLARGDRVAVVAPASAQLLEVHFGVPAAGGVIVAVDGRAEEAEAAAILRRSAARVLLADAACERAATAAARRAGVAPVLVWGAGRRSYEAFLAGARSGPPVDPRVDEDDVLSLAFGGDSGAGHGIATTHRAAYLDAVAEVHHARLDTRSVFLWTDATTLAARAGFPWAVTAAAATHVCGEAVEGADLRACMADEGVTHVGAPPRSGDALYDDSSGSDGPALLWSTRARADEAHGFRITRVVGSPAGAETDAPQIDAASWDVRGRADVAA
jgi:fatty-acyl-CoA synthase